MGYKDDLVRKKDGSYILRHKTKKGKEGDCIECGQNPRMRMLLFRYKTEDMRLVRAHIEDHLRTHFDHKSVTPIWCKKCQALLEYKVHIDYKKMYKRERKTYTDELMKEEENETSSYI